MERCINVSSHIFSSGRSQDYLRSFHPGQERDVPLCRVSSHINWSLEMFYCEYAAGGAVAGTG